MLCIFCDEETSNNNYICNDCDDVEDEVDDS